jgi:flavin-dependent dehydrogenase
MIGTHGPDVEWWAERGWDVVVVGAGPAGATAAREAARRGQAVLLLDKAAFPRWKVCGCCLNRSAQATLSALGLGTLLHDLGAVPLQRCQLAAGARQAVIPLPGLVAVSRERLDAALVEQARAAGVTFLPAAHASLGRATDSWRGLLVRRHGREWAVRARVVVLATGLHGAAVPETAASTAPGSRVGAGTVAEAAPEFFQPGTVFMACGHHGYVGLVRLEDGRLDVAAALDPDGVKRAGGLGPAAADVLGAAGFPAVAGLADLAWRGTPLLTRRLARPAAERVLVIGDAAGYVEPFTGEGIAWALASGAAVAPLACRAARRWEAALELQWAAAYRGIVVRRQRLCRAVAGVLRHPAVTRALVAVLARLPGLAAPVVRELNARLPVSVSRAPAVGQHGT